MKKRLLIVITILLSLGVILVGCTPATTTAGDPAKTTEPATTTTGEKPSGGDDGYVTTDPGTLPIVEGDPATLRVFFVAHPNVTDMDTNYATKWYEEKTNVKVDWQITSSADSQEKISMLLAANAKSDMPDVFLCGIGRPIAEAYGAQGVLADLTPHIESYGVNMKALFAHNDKLDSQMTAFDGNKYFLFRYYETVHVRHTQKIWMNQKWLENVDKKVPTTTDEYYDVLKAFLTEDANGNGDSTDEIPMIYYSGGYNGSFPMGLMESFVYSPPGVNKLFHENGKIQVSYAQEGWREGLRFYKKLYDEKLLDNELFSMTLEQAKALGAAEGGNRIGVVVGGTIGIYDFADPTIYEFEVIEALEGPTGLRQTALELFNPTPFFTMSAYCEIPEIAYRWADAQLYDSSGDIAKGDTTWLNFWYGEEGVGWELAGADDVGFTGDPAVYKWLFNWGENQNTHWYENFLINMPETWKPMIAADMGAGYQQEQVLYESTVEKMYPHATDKTVPTLSFTEDDAIEIAEIENDLVTYYSEMNAKFIRGEADLDNDWDAYLNELKNIGIERYLELYQAAFDR